MVATSRSERGETLIELLTAMSILGITVVAVVGGIGANLVMTEINRKQVTSSTVIRSYAETIKAGLTGSGKPYVACASAEHYAPEAFPVTAGYTTSVQTIRYWKGSSFTGDCADPLKDVGVQQLTLKVTSSDGKVKEMLDIVIRKPCPTAAACA